MTVMNEVLGVTAAHEKPLGSDDVLSEEIVAEPRLLRVCLVAEEIERFKGLSARLAVKGLVCSIATGMERAMQMVTSNGTDLALMAMDGMLSGSEMLYLPRRVRHEANLPVIALVSRSSLGVLAGSVDLDDFVVEPWDADEVAVRAWRIMKMKGAEAADNGELIRCGELTVDVGRCEVHVDGRLVELTFKEYELLRFLVSNKGRVFTREALLNKVWGYDYYGGDRTVDVHIRRLRSKLGEAGFIETVRNIGYRSRDDA
jgi:DNA-binding response OmpR family regulator